MRLLYITADMPFGSGEAFLIPEAWEILRQGNELSIVPRSPPPTATNHDADGLQCKATRQPLLNSAIFGAAICETLRHPLAVARAAGMLLQSRNASVLAKNLCVLPKGLWLGRMASSLRADHIHAHWGSTTATMAMIASRVSRIPWSLTLHRFDIAENNLLAAKIADVAFVRFISESGRRMAESLGIELGRNKAVVLHVGVTIPPAPAPWKPAEAAGITLLCPANLLPVKGHQYLLQAAAVLKSRGVAFRLDIAGKGPLRGELEAMAQSLSIADRVQFLGQVSHDRLLAMHRQRAADLLVLPSVDLGNNLHEGIPVTLMEAMAHGIPVVSTYTGGIPELLRDGAGMMVPHQNSEALAEAIECLVRNPGLRRQIGEAGRRRIEEEFDVEKITSQLVDLIRGGKTKSTRPDDGAAAEPVEAKP